MTSRNFLQPIDAKLRRSRQLAEEVSISINSWVQSNPISIRCDLGKDRFGFQLIQDDYADEPPFEEWAVMIGDCIHNLRSALDNLAYALARAKADNSS